MPKPNLSCKPVTVEESLFVGFLILHLNSAYQAIRNGVMDAPEGLANDIRTFFALPIPRTVWEKKRCYLDAKFVSFVESHLDEAGVN